MNECPICQSPVRWTPMPECETETTGRVALWECIRCDYYYEKMDKRKIKANPCQDGVVSPPPEKIAPEAKKNETEDAEDVINRDGDKYQPIELEDGGEPELLPLIDQQG